MGPGVGLEVGNSIYFDMPPDQFAYWNTDDAGREMVRALIRSGHIDCLHSYGDLATTRRHAARALDELARHDCRLRVWIDHGTAATNFGLGHHAGLRRRARPRGLSCGPDDRLRRRVRLARPGHERHWAGRCAQSAGIFQCAASCRFRPDATEGGGEARLAPVGTSSMPCTGQTKRCVRSRCGMDGLHTSSCDAIRTGAGSAPVTRAGTSATC